jgi:hypothetical protein
MLHTITRVLAVLLVCGGLLGFVLGGVSYTEFFRLLGQKGLSFINAGPEETDKSFEGFHHKMEHSKE